MISVGVLYDAQKLLRHVDSIASTAEVMLSSFRRLEVADFATVLSLSQQCQWIEVDDASRLTLSTRGREICEIATAELQLRHQIRDVLSRTGPAWAKKIADGRSEAIKIMPEPVQQVFREAGLLSDWTDDLVDWWDSIGLAARTTKSEMLLQIGRKAERLSLKFEEDRTGRRPQWKCIDSNYAGYDILSIFERSDPRPCAIEVKGSVRRLKEATFIVTRNEWQVAQGRETYRLHLWLLRDEIVISRDFRVIGSHAISPHIPSNNCDGEWLNVEIPFASFWN